jgi:hypothetical protein
MVSLGNSLTGLFSEIGNKEHEKKSKQAENYMLQISGLLASGDPQDRERAMMFLEDPKIKKTLKTGLEYVPLEEEVPPEAQGVQKAAATIKQKMSGGGGQQQQPKPQMRPVIPQASQQDQLRSVMTNALLDKFRKDPASAISMMGGSQLSSAETRASEFYTSGLGMSPVQVATMDTATKMQGMKMYEGVMRDVIKAEVDIYKADKGYSKSVDTAKIIAAARDRMTDAVKSAKDKKGAMANYAAGAKVYADLAKQYMDMSKTAKTAGGQPLSDEQRKVYEGQAREYQQKADDLLQQHGDEELIQMFLGTKAISDDESETTTTPEKEE